MTRDGLEVPNAAAKEADLVARLRAGDEHAFQTLVARHYATMLAVARAYVGAWAAAEEVVQEAWLSVLHNIDRCEERTSLKTWILAILVDKSTTRAAREQRATPFASPADECDAPALDPDRFRGPDQAFPGHWRTYPGTWGASPDTALQDRQTLEVTMQAIAALPPPQ